MSNDIRTRHYSCKFAALAATFLLLGVTHSMAQQDLPRTTPESVGVSSSRLQRVGEAIQRHMDAKHISGAVSLVVRKGFVVHFERTESRTSTRRRR